MTEMPAKTPNPIGSTCSFLPGIANGVAEELSAAAVPEDAAPADATEEVPLVSLLGVDALDATAEVDDALETVLLALADDETETEVTGYKCYEMKRRS